jgi:predicted ATP-dependent endonuclease of OLD family
VVVGANGSGKTTLFDVLGFLHESLKGNVQQAIDARDRFKEVLSRDSDSETIEIEIQYRMTILRKTRLVTYSLEIGERNGAVSILSDSGGRVLLFGDAACGGYRQVHLPPRKCGLTGLATGIR